jgi:hypothetical protein
LHSFLLSFFYSLQWSAAESAEEDDALFGVNRRATLLLRTDGDGKRREGENKFGSGGYGGRRVVTEDGKFDELVRLNLRRLDGWMYDGSIGDG